MIPAEKRIFFLLISLVIKTREADEIITVTSCFTMC